MCKLRIHEASWADAKVMLKDFQVFGTSVHDLGDLRIK